MLLRRYLVSFDPKRVFHRLADVVIVGAGVAGLRAALEVAKSKAHAVLITKGPLRESNTDRAQGGIAAVLDPNRTGDSIEHHLEDTVKCGCGLSKQEIVKITVSEGVERVRELIKWGAKFDLSLIHI